jgi:hypothetical protein
MEASVSRCYSCTYLSTDLIAFGHKRSYIFKFHHSLLYVPFPFQVFHTLESLLLSRVHHVLHLVHVYPQS